MGPLYRKIQSERPDTTSERCLTGTVFNIVHFLFNIHPSVTLSCQYLLQAPEAASTCTFNIFYPVLAFSESRGLMIDSYAPTVAICNLHTCVASLFHPHCTVVRTISCRVIAPLCDLIVAIPLHKLGDLFVCTCVLRCADEIANSCDSRHHIHAHTHTHSSPTSFVACSCTDKKKERRKVGGIRKHCTIAKKTMKYLRPSPISH